MRLLARRWRDRRGMAPGRADAPRRSRRSRRRYDLPLWPHARRTCLRPRRRRRGRACRRRRCRRSRRSGRRRARAGPAGAESGPLTLNVPPRQTRPRRDARVDAEVDVAPVVRVDEVRHPVLVDVGHADVEVVRAVDRRGLRIQRVPGSIERGPRRADVVGDLDGAGSR